MPDIIGFDAVNNQILLSDGTRAPATDRAKYTDPYGYQKADLGSYYNASPARLPAPSPIPSALVGTPQGGAAPSQLSPMMERLRREAGEAPSAGGGYQPGLPIPTPRSFLDYYPEPRPYGGQSPIGINRSLGSNPMLDLIMSLVGQGGSRLPMASQVASPQGAPPGPAPAGYKWVWNGGASPSSLSSTRPTTSPTGTARILSAAPQATQPAEASSATALQAPTATKDYSQLSTIATQGLSGVAATQESSRLAGVQKYLSYADQVTDPETKAYYQRKAQDLIAGSRLEGYF